MQQEAAKRGATALAPAPQGPLGYLALVQLESRGGEHTSRSGTPITRTSSRGLSAQSSKRKSGQSRSRSERTKARRQITRRSRTRTTPKTVPYRKGGCPPGYRYDRRNKMCVRTD